MNRRRRSAKFTLYSVPVYIIVVPPRPGVSLEDEHDATSVLHANPSLSHILHEAVIIKFRCGRRLQSGRTVTF